MGRRLVPLAVLSLVGSAAAQAACPVTGTLSFAAAVPACPDAASACSSTCTTALAMPFILTGLVSPTNAAVIGSCISSYAGSIIGSGVPVAVLSALSTCGSAAASPPPPSQLSPPPPVVLPPPAAATCPISAALDFSGAASSCGSVSVACSASCSTALGTPIVLAGVSPTNAPVIGACIAFYAGSIISAGVPPSVLAALSTCGSPAASPPPVVAASPPPAAATCPVSAALDFSGAVAACGSVSLACSASCSTALGTPIVIAGVSPTYAPVIGACIASYAGSIIGAGVPPAVLSALSSCGSPASSPPPKAASPPSAATCPVTAALDFSGAVTACGSVSLACSASCSTALGTPIAIAGASSGGTGVSPTNVPVITACIASYAGSIIAAGVPPAVLSALSTCGSPAASPPPRASPPPAATCPISSPLDFAGATSACGSVAAACSTACSTALATPIIIAGGVSPSNVPVISACISSYAGSIIGVGVPVAVLSALSTCGSAAASPPPASASSSPARPSPPPPPPALIRCPVPASMALDFTPAAVLCGSAAAACTDACGGALSFPFVGSGVSATDNATLGACVTARYMDIVGAGVGAPVLLARAACLGASFPFPPPVAPPPPPPSQGNSSSPVVAAPAPPPLSCPIKFALSFFGAPLACQNASTYCTDCANALSLPIALAGVAGNAPLVSACLESHALEVLAAGVAPVALQQARACFASWTSPPPPLPPPPYTGPPGVSASFSSGASATARSTVLRVWSSSAATLILAPAIVLLHAPGL